MITTRFIHTGLSLFRSLRTLDKEGVRAMADKAMGKKKVLSPGQAALWTRHDGMALVHLELPPENDQPALIKECAFLARHDRNPIAAPVVRKWVQSLGMDGLPFVSLMELGQYALFPVEEPSVPRAERADAVKWRVKDRLDFPVTEAVVDVFDMPGSGMGRPSGKVYVVAARETEVRACAQLFHDAKLDLRAIDILELALANLTNRLPENQDGICLLRLGLQGGIVQVTRQNALYLSRTIDVGSQALVHGTSGPDSNAASLAATPILDTIALEVQRTLDYYESYFSTNPVARLYVAPMATNFPFFEEALAEKMGVMVSRLPVERIITGTDAYNNELVARCLPAMGAALRPASTGGTP